MIIIRQVCSGGGYHIRSREEYIVYFGNANGWRPDQGPVSRTYRLIRDGKIIDSFLYKYNAMRQARTLDVDVVYEPNTLRMYAR